MTLESPQLCVLSLSDQYDGSLSLIMDKALWTNHAGRTYKNSDKRFKTSLTRKRLEQTICQLKETLYHTVPCLVFSPYGTRV
jgi:hypothetical protein